MIATITLFLVGCAFFLIWTHAAQQPRRRASGDPGQSDSWSSDSSDAPAGYASADDGNGNDSQSDACGADGGSDSGGSDGGGDCGGGD